MIVEFVLVDEPDDVLTSIYDGVAAPRKGESIHIQTEKRAPFTEYIVDRVEWQLDADDQFGAICHVRLPSGFGD
jgi:hypothetical protein